MQDDDIPKIFYGPVFPELIQGVGTGPDARLPGGELIQFSFCAWYFCKLAMIQLEEIPAQVTMEGDKDTHVKLRDQLDRIMQVYGLTDIDTLMNLMPKCREIAFARNIKWDDRFQAWLDSGGRAYNDMDRDPDKI